jgi:NitT/TauT family transport system ATP-binding protein
MYLDVHNLYKQFNTPQGSLLALQNINMQVKEGEFVCAVGASGSGKSTLLRLMAGLETPTRGAVRVDGICVTGPGADRGMVFQHYTLYPWMNVEQNVGFGLKLRGISRFERRDRVREYLDVVGLSPFARSNPNELSGGMRQRVAIARALASEPKILLMDEPFGALDIQTKEDMQEFLLDLWQRTRKTIFMITHDVEEAVFLSNRIYVLSARPGSVQREVIIDQPTQRHHGSKRQRWFLDHKDEITVLLRGPSRQDTLVA